MGDRNNALSLAGQTWKRIGDVITANTVDYKKKNPLLYKSVSPSKPASASAAGPVSSVSSSNDPTVIDHNYKRAIASKMLFLARVKEGNPHIVLPALREQFKMTFQQGKIELIRRYYKSLMKDFAKQRQKRSRDFFTKSINIPEWNACRVKLWLNACLHDDGLDSKHLLRYSISLLNFLAENPYDDNLVQYQNKTKEEEIEMDVENEKNRSKLSLETYLGGLQERPEHVITALANLECHLAAAEEFDHEADEDKPLIVYMIRQFADVIASQEFQQFANRYATKFPWLAHTLIVYCQMFFSEFAAIARNNELIFKVLKGVDIDVSIFNKVQHQFRDMIQDLNNAASYQKITPFQMAPSSYKAPTTSQTSKARENDNNGGREGNETIPPRKRIRSEKARGWLNASGPVRWPPLSERICTRYAQIGAICRHEHCEFKHKTYPNNFSDEDRRVIHKYVTETPHLEFGPTVNYVPKATEAKKDDEASILSSPKKKSAAEKETESEKA